jgi:hypothetical protein
VECQASITAFSSVVNYARSRCCAASGAGDASVPPVCGREFVFVAVRQAWREVNELRGRTLMRDGDWLT